MLAFEQESWEQHPGRRLAGVDEAGRGPLAGPVAAAAVTMSQTVAETLLTAELAGLTDSKKLSASRREQYFSILEAHPGVEIGVGWVDAATIDEINILRATHRAMGQALSALSPVPDFALVDGLPVKGLPCPSRAIVKGDALSFLIAAASVVAKVLRDRLMLELDSRFPGYGFVRNKGYGTHEHMRALLKHGPSPVHRKSFRPVAEFSQILMQSLMDED